MSKHRIVSTSAKVTEKALKRLRQMFQTKFIDRDVQSLRTCASKARKPFSPKNRWFPLNSRGIKRADTLLANTACAHSRRQKPTSEDLRVIRLSSCRIQSVIQPASYHSALCNARSIAPARCFAARNVGKKRRYIIRVCATLSKRLTESTRFGSKQTMNCKTAAITNHDFF